MASTTSYLSATVAFLLSISGRTLPEISDSTEIAARLSGGGLMECWDALYELKSCTNEILLFFLNGETKLGVDCCRSIGVITTDCWPAMLTSLGFTSEETSVLGTYCHSSPAPSPLKL